MITKAEVYGLDARANELKLVVTITPREGESRDAVLRRAYNSAQEWLIKHYPNEWVYRYGDLEAGDYTGQFQWKEGGWGKLVPASVRYTDPEEEAEYERQQAIRRAEEARVAARVRAKVDALPPMTIAPYKDTNWQTWRDNNQDGYGAAIVHYAERWARLMEAEIDRNPKATYAIGTGVFAEIAERTSHEADIEGITGFMYGAAVSMLADVWIYGDQLKRWHNNEYGQPDAQGVVNPAVMVLNTADEAVRS